MVPDRRDHESGSATWPDLRGRRSDEPRLPDLLRLGPSEIVAVVGAGGKSTLLERLALDYEAEESRVIITTTTMVRPPAPGGRPLVTGESPASLLASLRREPRRSPLVGHSLSGGKLRGLPPEWIPTLRDLPWVEGVLVEADGAVGLPLKAPAAYEPVLPAETSMLVSVSGLDAAGLALEEGMVHRPELLSELLGLPLGAFIPPAALLEVAGSGYRHHCPPGARFLVVLNKADNLPPSSELEKRAAIGPDEVWTGSALTGDFRPLKVPPGRPAAVVLAAGLASRMGGEKLLAPLGVGSVLSRVVGAVAGHPDLGQVVVVTGEQHERIVSMLNREVPVGVPRVVRNLEPGRGQSSSLRLGASAVVPPADLLVLLGDQPFVTVETVTRLLLARADNPRTAVVGLLRSGRGQPDSVRPPLILHRSLIPQVLGLTGDQGARTLLSRYAGSLVALPARDMELLDVDTPEDLAIARMALERLERVAGNEP